MKITRKRLEEILREEIAAIKERQSYTGDQLEEIGGRSRTPEEQKEYEDWHAKESARKPFDAFFPPGSGKKAAAAKPKPAPKMSADKLSAKKYYAEKPDPVDLIKFVDESLADRMDVQVYNEEADDLESMRRDLENAASDAKGKKKGSALGAAAKGAFTAGGVYQAVQALQGLAAMGSAAMEKAMSKLDPEMVAAIADAAQSVGSAVGLEEGKLQEAVSADERSGEIRKAAAKCRNAGKHFDHSELRKADPKTGQAIPFSEKLKNACKDKVKEGYGEEEYTPMMPPKETALAAAVGSIINGLRSGELSPEGAADRLESQVQRKLYRLRFEEGEIE